MPKVPPIVVPVEPEGVNEIRSPSLAILAPLGVMVADVPAALFDAVRTRGEPVIAVPEPGAVPPATDGMIATATEQSVVKAPCDTPVT